ncbi:uncharacterized protein LOC102709162 [Oryza brachyantha]|uniref:uncharacterized protein LOC102709162 n=1 Tax=Oryza brachyantha TaxID=4533 RepID=UPI001AD9948C|nr:uncharacterized protein LOC102709162 [Oryza brachyantha]
MAVIFLRMHMKWESPKNVHETGKEITADEAGGSKGSGPGCEHVNKLPPPLSAEEEAAAPEWLRVLLRTKFWGQCKQHVDASRSEECIFCLRCCKVLCPHCDHAEPGHRLLKVRRYMYRSVVLAKDMQDLNVDVSRIQVGVDISQDEFSGPEAERRHRQVLGNVMESPPLLQNPPRPFDASPVEDEDAIMAEAERGQVQTNATESASSAVAAAAADEIMAEAPVINVDPHSLRRRSRKQAEPQRAPFF